MDEILKEMLAKGLTPDQIKKLLNEQAIKNYGRPLDESQDNRHWDTELKSRKN